MQDPCVCGQPLSPVWLFVIPRIAACQAPLSVRFSRQEYCHFPLLGIFPTQGSNPHLLHFLYRQKYSLPLHHLGSPYKRLSTMLEIRVWSLGWEDPLEKEMAIHSSTIAWKIPRTEEPGRLQSMGLQRVGHDRATSIWLFTLCKMLLLLLLSRFSRVWPCVTP